MKENVTQSCLTLCDPMDYIIHGILQARILEWVAFPFSRGSFQPSNRTQSPTFQVDSLPAKPSGKPKNIGVGNLSLLQWIFPIQESNWETQVWSLGGKDPLKKEMATHSSILAWRTPGTEEPGGPQSMGSQSIRHDWAINFLSSMWRWTDAHFSLLTSKSPACEILEEHWIHTRSSIHICFIK